MTRAADNASKTRQRQTASEAVRRRAWEEHSRQKAPDHVGPDRPAQRRNRPGSRHRLGSPSRCRSYEPNGIPEGSLSANCDFVASANQEPTLRLPFAVREVHVRRQCGGRQGLHCAQRGQEDEAGQAQRANQSAAVRRRAGAGCQAHGEWRRIDAQRFWRRRRPRRTKRLTRARNALNQHSACLVEAFASCRTSGACAWRGLLRKPAGSRCTRTKAAVVRRKVLVQTARAFPAAVSNAVGGDPCRCADGQRPVRRPFRRAGVRPPTRAAFPFLWRGQRTDDGRRF